MYYPKTNNPRSLWSYHLGLNPPEEAQRRVLRLDAYAQEHSYYKLVGSSEVVSGMSVKLERPKPPPGTQGGPIYLPVHRHCLHIADCFVDSIETSIHTLPKEYSGKITSIRQLWEVLYRRLHGDILAHEYELQEPHDYFGGRLCRNVDWEARDDIEHGEVRILVSVYYV
jgi:hypothetical protein